MTMFKTRLERLEEEQRFNQWFQLNSVLSRCTEEELEVFVKTGELADSIYCESFTDRPSCLDGLDRKSLFMLFEEDERFFGNLSNNELKVYAEHRTLPGLGREETAKHNEKHFKRREEILRQARRRE
jgi:hypothetical protein